MHVTCMSLAWCINILRKERQKIERKKTVCMQSIEDWIRQAGGGGCRTSCFPFHALQVPTPFHSGFCLCVLFLLWNIAQCFPNFSQIPPPWVSHLLPSLPLSPVDFSLLLLLGSCPPLPPTFHAAVDFCRRCFLLSLLTCCPWLEKKGLLLLQWNLHYTS